MKRWKTVVIVCGLLVGHRIAGAANSNWIGPGSDLATAANWSNGVPTFTDNAVFNTATPTSISLNTNAGVFNGIIFNPGASGYTFTISPTGSFSTFNGGIINNSVNTQTFNNSGGLAIVGTGIVTGNITLQNSGSGDIVFSNSAMILSSTRIINDHLLIFQNTSSAGNATIINNAGATLSMKESATLSFANLTNNGLFDVQVDLRSVGPLSGSGIIQLGSNNLSIMEQMNTTYSGVITGLEGSIDKDGGGTLTLAGANTYTGDTRVEVGTLNVLGSITSDVILNVNLAAVLTGTGTVQNIMSNANVTPGVAGHGTLKATGYSGAGNFNTIFDGSSHGTLNVMGNADIAGQTWNVTGSTFAVGRYSALHATSLSGIFTAFNAPASSLLTFTPDYSATDAFVRIDFATQFLPFAQNTNQRSVAANLNGSRDTSTAEFTDAINTIAGLPAAQIPDAYMQISGDSLASFQNLGLQNAALFTHGMVQRAVDVSSSSYGLWAKSVGYLDSMDGDSTLGSPESKAVTGGFQAGYDYQLDDDLVAGFSGGYAHTSVNVDDRDSSGNTQSIQTGLYAELKRGPWTTHGELARTANMNGMSRSIHFGSISETAESDFKSQLYTTLIQTRYALEQRRSFALEPTASMRFNHLSQAGFTESGAPGLGLTIADRSLNSWVSSLGLNIKRLFCQGSAHPLLITGITAWEHEWGENKDVLSAHFAETSGGSDFTVEGTPRSRNAGVLGVEGQMPLRENLALTVSYNATLASAQKAQRISGGFTYRF